MVTYKGYSTGLMYKAEAVYGTAVTVDTAIQGKVTAFTADWNNNFFREQGLGEGRNETVTGFGPFDVGGTIEGSVGEFDFFAHGIGGSSGSGTAASPYVLNEGANVGFTGNDIKSFTMQAFDDRSTDMVDTYAGCLLNNITFTATQGDYLRFSADWIGKTVATDTSGETFSADTTDIWSFQQGTFKWDSTPTEVAKVTSFTVTISNNLYVYRALGSRLIEQPEAGLRKYDFTIVCKMTDSIITTLQQDVLGQANSPHLGQSSSSPSATNEIQLYFTGPTNKEAYIQLDECFLNSMSKPINLGEGIIEVTFTGFARIGKSNQPIKWQNAA